jgi:hypothetical protein
MKLFHILLFLSITQTTSAQTNKTMQAEQIITQLETLEYYKYLTGDDKSDFKKYLQESIQNGWLDMPNQVLVDLKRENKIQRDKPESIDKRSAIVNGEDLFRGGLESTLEKFKTIFDSRNLEFKYENNSEVYSGPNNNHLNHKIDVNGRTYQIFDKEMERGASEMDYLKSLINLLNKELEEQDFKSEKFIVLSSMETLYFILIDDKTIEYIKSISDTIENRIIDLNSY